MRSRARGLGAETALVIVAACHGGATKESPSTTDATSAAASASAAPSASVARTPSAPPASYAEALKLGRDAMQRSAFEEAVFDFKAAVSFGDTAQAEAELGYAQLQANHLDDALGSLRNAVMLAPPPLLLSQVEFNVGLVREKRGEAELARAAFARAYALHASDAAKDKLAGKSMCAASIVKEPLVVSAADAGSGQYIVTRSWRDVWTFAAARGASLMATIHDWTIVPKSDAHARALVCTDTSNPDAGASLCAGPGPWRINVGHLMMRDDFVYVLADASGQLLVVESAMEGGGCNAMGARPASSSSVSARGSVLEVHMTTEWWNEDNCTTGKTPAADHVAVFYDLVTRTIVTVSAGATLTARTVTIDAKSCTPVSLDP